MPPANTDIICFALSRWDSPISSPSLSLAVELAKDHRVFYIDHPFSWKDLITEYNTEQVKSRRPVWFGPAEPYHRSATFPDKLVFVVPPVTIPVNFLPEGKLYAWLSSRNQQLMEKLLSRIISDFGIKKYIFINFFDPFFFTRLRSSHSLLASQTGKESLMSSDTRKTSFMASQTGKEYLMSSDTRKESKYSQALPVPRAYIYQCMDEISEVSYTAKHGVRLEREVVEHADLTICTSRALTDKYRGIGRVEYLPNAVDFELFKAAFLEQLPRPAIFEKFAGSKIIGFTGSVDYRTDFGLVRLAAEKFPGTIFLFIGPVITVEHKRYEPDDLPNVVFVPARPISDLPAFLQHMDVLIIPYKKNALTNAIYPLKINEYLAAGKPVVATGFSEDIRSFSDLIYLAETDEQFVEGIASALEENDETLRHRRFECAASNSWKQRADQLRQFFSD